MLFTYIILPLIIKIHIASSFSSDEEQEKPSIELALSRINSLKQSVMAVANSSVIALNILQNSSFPIRNNLFEESSQVIKRSYLETVKQIDVLAAQAVAVKSDPTRIQHTIPCISYANLNLINKTASEAVLKLSHEMQHSPGISSAINKIKLRSIADENMDLMLEDCLKSRNHELCYHDVMVMANNRAKDAVLYMAIQVMESSILIDLEIESGGLYLNSYLEETNFNFGMEVQKITQCVNTAFQTPSL